MCAYRNELKAYREAAFLTRAQLLERVARTAESDPTSYSPISIRNLERLEKGDIRPRASTALTLAVTLKAEVVDLFPNGLADANRNPLGNTNPPKIR